MAGHSIQHADGSRTCIDYADAEGSAVVNGRVWRWEFNEWGGPLWLRADGEPRKCQYPTAPAVWDAFTRWHHRYERAKRAQKAGLCEGNRAWLAEGSPSIQEWGDGFAPIIEVKPNQ